MTPGIIFQPCFLIDSNGQHPAPFTSVSHKDIVDGTYKATMPEFQQLLYDYTKTLEDKGQTLNWRSLK